MQLSYRVDKGSANRRVKQVRYNLKVYGRKCKFCELPSQPFFHAECLEYSAASLASELADRLRVTDSAITRKVGAATKTYGERLPERTPGIKKGRHMRYLCEAC